MPKNCGIREMTTEEQEAVYDAFHHKVGTYIKSRISHPQDAEDEISVVFLKVYGALNHFDPNKASLSTWIYTITRNTVNDYFRNHGKRQPTADIDELSLPTPLEELPEEVYIREENLDLLATALEQIPQRDRDMVILLYYHEKSLKDVAQLLGISYGNAKFIHHSAIKKLRAVMEKITK